MVAGITIECFTFQPTWDNLNTLLLSFLPNLFRAQPALLWYEKKQAHSTLSQRRSHTLTFAKKPRQAAQNFLLVPHGPATTYSQRRMNDEDKIGQKKKCARCTTEAAWLLLMESTHSPMTHPSSLSALLHAHELSHSTAVMVVALLAS